MQQLFSVGLATNNHISDSKRAATIGCLYQMYARWKIILCFKQKRFCIKNHNAIAMRC
jgi:hypothetical protein